jgi:hypothetical protein
MSKASSAPKLGSASQVRVAELDPKQAVACRLNRIIIELERLNEDVAAAYAQMALDMIRR